MGGWGDGWRAGRGGGWVVGGRGWGAFNIQGLVAIVNNPPQFVSLINR